MSPVTRTLALALTFTAAAAPLLAQTSRLQSSLTGGATWLDFNGFGGAVGGAHMGAGLHRDLTPTTAWEIGGFWLLPSGQTSIQPSCTVGATCVSRMSPASLAAATFGVRRRLGADGRLRLTGAVGGLHALGVEGTTANAAIVSVGADWTPQGERGFLFTLRAVRLSSPVTGLRQFVMPGVGFVF